MDRCGRKATRESTALERNTFLREFGFLDSYIQERTVAEISSRQIDVCPTALRQSAPWNTRGLLDSSRC